ncbi:MAG: crossover junction endodeoxyribonuclease RuvC [Rikenellaceae bacterium]
MIRPEHYRILGIDPGTNYMGYGVVEVRGSKVLSVVMGVIDMHRLEDPYAKLKMIFDRVRAIIDEYKPREVALEAPFFGENVQSMLKLGRAQGVAMSAALSREIDVFEYAPTRIKQAVTGQGSASKEQLATMVKSILGLKDTEAQLDATDGMAAALCHFYTTTNPLNGHFQVGRTKGLGGGRKELKRGGSSSWEQFIKSNPDREVGGAKKTVKKPTL